MRPTPDSSLPSVQSPQPSGKTNSFSYPVVSITLPVFLLVAITAQNLLDSVLIVLFLIPLVVGVQWLARWTLQRLRVRVWVRRSFMLAPALFLAAYIFHTTNAFGGRQRAAIKQAIGHVPANLSEVHVEEGGLNTYFINAFARCDPHTLKSILENRGFTKSRHQPRLFDFTKTPFQALHSLSPIPAPLEFERDMIRSGLAGRCTVTTDESFSFFYIDYEED